MPSTCVGPSGYGDNKDKDLTEFMMYMQDRYQRTLGTTEPNAVILMMRQLRKRKGK